MASHSSLRLSDAFQNAKQDFLDSLKDPSLFNSISTVTSIHDVYAFTSQLQEDQSKRHGLRNLRKISPYLDRLKQFAGVIEVFVSAKPEILALIWGPIKLLLQMSDNLTKSFDAIVEAMAIIGNKLPLFESYVMLFKENDRVADVLVLFYKDILDFYEITLNLFTTKRWVFVFDSVWPRHKAKISVVVGNIEQHCLLMTDQVTLENISGAHKARIEDMNRWQRNFEFQERQDFKSVEDYISPRLYDDELDRLQRTVCERTGRWLQREQTLKKWIDTSDKSTKVVWLQGIPGAGKTHISSIIVDKLRGLSHTTLFAFLSYKQGQTSTVSIIHSLIFQLVIGMESFDEILKQDLRAKLFHTFQSSQRNLKSSTKFARQTLIELLKCVGPTYIIIDGLDELPKSDHRVEILKELLEMLNVSAETRLLISSRAQDEIAAVLKATTKIIRVDENNSGCIQAYVSVKSESWLAESGFDEHACSEIKGLLNPLAKKAKGMFLYARVVMDNIQMCHTSDQVQNELAVLPESLDEAYARVFQRLDDFPFSSKVMSRRALGWIGCSPIPIKIQELSFALGLDPDGKSGLPRTESVLNIVRLCGPIVETFDDHVYFVHFTVKEYLFDRQDNQFVRQLEANLEIARTCLHYLSLNIFDVGLEPDTVRQNILSGSYGLHWFAATQWMVLIQDCAKLLGNRPPPEDLLKALNRFANECENGNYESTVDFDSQESDRFQIFRDSVPNIHKLLHEESHFRHLDVGDWTLEEEDYDDSWTNLDPFYLSYTSLGIYEQFELLLCPKESHMANCNCSKLKNLYGERLFRCKYHMCQSEQISFETKSAREAHCRAHARPYKCMRSLCDFSTLGFSSLDQLKRHKSNCHPDIPLKPIQMIENHDDDELVPLVLDMIAMGMTAEVEALSPRLKHLDFNLLRTLAEQAAFSGTLRVYKCLSNLGELNANYEHHISMDDAQVSIEGENAEVLEWLLSEYVANDFLSHLYTRRLLFTKLGANTDSAAVFKIWNIYFKFYYVATRHMIEYALPSVTDPAKQERLARALSEHASIGHLTTDDLGYALKAVASSTCSVSIAKVLLACGAAVDFRSSKSHTATSGQTPLILAAAKKTREGAEMMKLLLLAGADPNAFYLHKKNGEPTTPGMGKGAKQISKWLGMTWDELVKWAAEQRSSSKM